MLTTFMSRKLVCAAIVLGGLTATARSARACGGFFCDRPPPDGSLPIAQAGENVLFVFDHDPQSGQGHVEAHIQILYSGTAAQFSWVVPVTALPTLDVGSDVLFDQLEPATRPSFRAMFQMDGTCKGFGGDSSAGCGSSSNNARPGTAESAAGGVLTQADDGVEVVFRGNVGPYDSAVIRSDDPTALETWLATNGYFVGDDAKRIVADYVAAHAYFVALRLQQGQDTSAIRPIVLKMTSDEGCLPLKLTAIAATPDLRANVWVLGDARAVPLDYLEIGIDQAKIDWINFGRNYDQLLGEAANEAGGDAFAVEYAKPSAAVGATFAVSPGAVAQLAGETAPASYLFQLQAMNIAPTGQALAILRKYIPLPDALKQQGVTESQLYGNPGRYAYSVPSTNPPFDPAAMTAELQTAVFAPMTTLQPLFTNHPYLTRLATFISPEEMTKDPRFVTNADLGDVDPQHVAVAHLLCGDQDFDVCHAPVRLHLADGTDVNYAVAAGAPATCNPSVTPTYDRTGVDLLPSADVGWLRDPVGPGHMVVDQRAAITAGLAKQNATVQTSAGCSCAVIRGRGRPAALAFVLAAALSVARLRRRRRR